MKIQIRRGCFETNSSSVHALCLGKGDFSIPESIKFGVLTLDEYWKSLNTYQYRADALFAGIIGKNDYDCAKAFERFGKLIELLKETGINYSFNLTEDYIDYQLPYIEETKWVDKVLENKDTLLRYLFSDNSNYLEYDRDNLYNRGGWEEVVDLTKCDLYDTD